MSETGKSINLGFLTTELRNQIAHSKNVLTQAEALRQLANTERDEQLKLRMFDIANALLVIANGIAQTVAMTSNAASNTVSSVTYGSSGWTTASGNVGSTSYSYSPGSGPGGGTYGYSNQPGPGPVPVGTPPIKTDEK
jgi:uncharacterized membrane protein